DRGRRLRRPPRAPVFLPCAGRLAARAGPAGPGPTARGRARRHGGGAARGRGRAPRAPAPRRPSRADPRPGPRRLRALADRWVPRDSGVGEGARAQAGRQLADGSARLATGTRSALLAPAAEPGMLVLLDEHEAAHKPPGPPRIHSREVVLERAAREGLTLLLTSATPSVEMWWQAGSGRADAVLAPQGAWPAVSLADTRGILRREPLTPPLARAIRETLAAGRRVFLAVSRLTSALACDECGTVVRCAQCMLAVAYSGAAAKLECR